MSETVATRIFVFMIHKVLTPCQAHVCHKFTHELLRWAPEPFQNFLAMPLNILFNDFRLNVTAVKHVSINFICIESWSL
jgi:hypothetical protein